MGTQITNWFVPYSVTPSRLDSPATFSSDRDIRLEEEDDVLLNYNAFGLSLNAIGEEVEVNAANAQTSAIPNSGNKTNLKLGFAYLYLRLRTTEITQIKNPTDAKNIMVSLTALV